MKYLFYVAKSCSGEGKPLLLDSQYYWRFWKSSVRRIVPEGVPFTPFAVWWVFHYTRVFSNPDYGMLVVYQGETLVHKSCIFPRYFRFPFMSEDDLQIGDIWTHPRHRGKGIATFAIQKVVELKNKPGRKFWYVVDETNNPSIRVIEKVGFLKIGEGVRTNRIGMGLFGSYVILKDFFSDPNS